MKMEAKKLCLADVVRLADGTSELTHIAKDATGVRVWFRGSDPEDEPSATFEPERVLEVERPGSLFAATPPPKTVAEARARIIERMAALGWALNERGGTNSANDYIADPSDTVRLKLKTEAVHLQVRKWMGSSWRWDPNTRSLGQMKAFAADLNDKSAYLLRVAKDAAHQRLELVVLEGFFEGFPGDALLEPDHQLGAFVPQHLQNRFEP